MAREARAASLAASIGWPSEAFQLSRPVMQKLQRMSQPESAME
jgi:hypothetical protein